MLLVDTITFPASDSPSWGFITTIVSLCLSLVSLIWYLLKKIIHCNKSEIEAYSQFIDAYREESRNMMNVVTDNKMASQELRNAVENNTKATERLTDLITNNIAKSIR